MKELKKESMDKVRSYVSRLLEILKEKAKIELEEKIPGEIYINLEGKLEILTEHDAPIVNSLSELLEVIFRRKFNLDKEVYLDINGAKANKREKLKNFSLKAAKRAKENGEKIRLNPMPSKERKLIHITVAELEGVDTYSVGEGEERRVIIEPKI